jgi:hypothetical protein
MRCACFAGRAAMGWVRVARHVTFRHMVHRAQHSRAARGELIRTQSADHAWQISKRQDDHTDNSDKSTLHASKTHEPAAYTPHDSDSIGKCCLTLPLVRVTAV